MEKSIQLIEELSESAIFVELADKSSIGALLTIFETLLEELNSGDKKELADICKTSVSILEDIILDECEKPEEQMVLINKIIEIFQRVIINQVPFEEIDLPAELSKNKDSGEGEQRELPSFVDDEIFLEFLSNQEAVLVNLEETILEYEKTSADNLVDKFKRIIHTLKGEAGLMGLNDVEKLCHKAEDIIEDGIKEGFADLLLEMIDWLKDFFASIEDSEKKVSPVNNLMAKFSACEENPITTSEKDSKISEGKNVEPEKEDAKSAENKKLASTEKKKKKQKKLLPEHIDDNFFLEFLANQEDVLHKMDEALSTLQKSSSPEALNTLKILFHNGKGEAGLLNLEPFGKICLASEQILDFYEIDGFFEILEEVLEWEQGYFRELTGDRKNKIPFDKIFEKLENFKNNAQSQTKEKSKSDLTQKQEQKKPDEKQSVILNDLSDIQNEFINKQIHVIEELESNILEIEKNGSEEAIKSLKGILHNQKGEAGLTEFHDIEKLCHKTEDVLEAGINKDISDILFTVSDWMKMYFKKIQEGKELETSISDILSKLDKYQNQDNSKGHKQKDDSEQNEPKEFTGDMELAMEFIDEAIEHLENADNELLEIEKNPNNSDALNSVFRAFHTIKGVAGFIGLDEVQLFAHNAENMLDNARQGKLILVNDAMEMVFKSVDKMKQMINNLGTYLSENKLPPPDKSLPAFLENINLVIENKETVKEEIIEKEIIDEEIVIQEDQGEEPKIKKITTRKVKESIKVDAEKLDLLVDTIGELVISESMISQALLTAEDTGHDLLKKINRMDKITKELQEMSTALRMVPVKSTFRKMARLARDTSRKMNKPIDFVMSGEDTELDKSLVEKIGDPLVHMIRNAVDHGIEDNPDIREKNGKSRVGHVELKAFHSGGSIHIEVVDDGSGLSKQVLIDKAIENGVITSAEGMTEQEIYGLIFAAGFSTAKKVTDVSGRGVGMDVVRKNIEALRGKIFIRSEEGQGSTFSIQLPLTLAIIDGMIIRVGEEKYIIPTLSVINSSKIDMKDYSTIVEKGEMISFQGNLLPLCRLSEHFAITKGEKDLTKGIIIVVEFDERRIALVADELLGQQQIVIKTISEMLKSVEGIAGGTIMPDGKVALILDIASVIKSAHNV